MTIIYKLYINSSNLKVVVIVLKCKLGLFLMARKVGINFQNPHYIFTKDITE